MHHDDHDHHQHRDYDHDYTRRQEEKTLLYSSVVAGYFTRGAVHSASTLEQEEREGGRDTTRVRESGIYSKSKILTTDFLFLTENPTFTVSSA